MKNFTLTALMISASFAVAACDSANDATADDGTVADNGTVTAPDDAAATTPAPDTQIVVENGTRFRVDPDGTRIRISPDGADLEIRDENVDINVGSDRRPSVDIEL